MRLLFCTTDGAGAFNGINSWLLDFLPVLAAAGHEPSVLVFAWSPAEACNTYPKLRERGIAAHLVFPRLYTEAAVRLCVSQATRLRPDVFVANHVLPALLALPQLRARGIPGVSVLHNDDAEYRAKASFPADASVAVSRRLLDLVPGDGRLARCIPCGAPLSARVAQPPNRGDRFRIVYHGRIAQRQKRILDTAGALVRVCRARSNFEADFYGSGPEEAALHLLLARDDAGGRVRFHGGRATADLRELLPAYHASVLLSDFEGMPVAILESMSAGLVPVCLRVESGLPEIIRHGESGLLVSDRKADFEAALISLAEDPAYWSRLSQAARTTIKEGFATAAVSRSWTHLCEQLVSRAARPTLPPSAARSRLPPIHPDLVAEDVRYPGLARALWRWLRFGPAVARRPW